MGPSSLWTSLGLVQPVGELTAVFPLICCTTCTCFAVGGLLSAAAMVMTGVLILVDRMSTLSLSSWARLMQLSKMFPGLTPGSGWTLLDPKRGDTGVIRLSSLWLLVEGCRPGQQLV